MRLRTCLAVEVCIGAVLLGGAGVGLVWTARAVPGYLAGTEAEAANDPAGMTRLPEAAITRLPPARLDVDPATPRLGTVFPAADEALLAPLRTARLVRVKLNHGGTSLSLRLDFDDGGRAAFKPEQTFFQSNPRYEIAAFRIDRLLGIGHVAPAIARRFTVDELVAAIDPSQRGWGTKRVLDGIVPRGGTIAGEVQWWIPDIIDARIEGKRVDVDEGITRWVRYLRAGHRVPDDAYEMTRQLSDLLLFDFLIDNLDRWTLSNTKGSPDGRVLYFMDNTLSFSPLGPGPKSWLYLHRTEKFSRHLVARLRAITREDIARLVDDDGPLGPLLSAEGISALLRRRDLALDYIDGLIARHGEADVLFFP